VDDRPRRASSARDELGPLPGVPVPPAAGLVTDRPIRRTKEERLLAFDRDLAWYANARADLVAVEPIPWQRPERWDEREPVCLGLTSHGQVQFMSAASLLRLVMVDQAITGPLFAQGPLVHETRRKIVEQFRDDPDLGKFLLFVDGDVVASPDLARALVTVAKDLELDVVSQCYPTIRGCCEAAISDPTEALADIAEPAFGAVVRVDFVGFGAVLLRRSVLDAMVEAFGRAGPDCLFVPAVNAPALGEDYAFCYRARELGARVATANVTRVYHLKTVPLAPRSQRGLPSLER
jgi:hypothetical protein